jgi:hypothetical protein
MTCIDFFMQWALFKKVDKVGVFSINNRTLCHEDVCGSRYTVSYNVNVSTREE